MAINMSIIEGINEIVETIGEFPMANTASSTPSGTGTSIYDRARQYLDRESKFVQSWGWPENTIIGKSYTASGAGAITITNPTKVLNVRAGGGSSHRNLVMRYNSSTLQLYDGNAGTFTFKANEVVYVDEVEALAAAVNSGGAADSAWGFELATPQLQQAIVDQAKLKFQRRYQGSMEVEAGLMQEAAMSDIRTNRLAPDIQQPYNVQPMMMPSPQRHGREG